MSTWSQWFVSQQKKQSVRQTTFLCGTEPILIEEVRAHVDRMLGVNPWNYVALSGEQDSRAFWAAMEALPIDTSFRLVVVRAVDKVEDQDRLVEWAAARARDPKTYTVLVSGEEKIPTLPPAEKGGKRLPHPLLAALGRRVQAVECRPFTQATAKHAVAWVRSLVPMQINVAAHLLNRANGDLRLVRDTCVKLKAFGEEATIPVIDALLSQRPRVDFRTALVQRRKKDALFALSRMSPDEYSRTIGQIDNDLDLAGLIYDMTNQHATSGEIARAAGRQAFLVPPLLPFAKHYDPKTRVRLRGALAVADEALRGGVRDGVLEGLVLQW